MAWVSSPDTPGPLSEEDRRRLRAEWEDVWSNKDVDAIRLQRSIENGVLSPANELLASSFDPAINPAVATQLGPDIYCGYCNDFGHVPSACPRRAKGLPEVDDEEPIHNPTDEEILTSLNPPIDYKGA